MKYIKSFNEAWMQPVLKFDSNDNFIDEYECVGDAAKANNINRTDIPNQIAGRKKLAGGFKWAYKHSFNSSEYNNIVSGKSKLDKKSFKDNFKDNGMSDEELDSAVDSEIDKEDYVEAMRLHLLKDMNKSKKKSIDKPINKADIEKAIDVALDKEDYVEANRLYRLIYES